MHVAVHEDLAQPRAPEHFSERHAVLGSAVDRDDADVHVRPAHARRRAQRVIHIEPANTSLLATLGTFSGIWGQPLSRTNVGGITGQPVTVYVKDDGQGLTEYTGDLAALELVSRREVTIVIGTPPAQIPTYAWGTERWGCGSFAPRCPTPRCAG